MSATIIPFARFQEIRQSRRSHAQLPGEQPLSMPEGELPLDPPMTIMCEEPAAEPVGDKPSETPARVPAAARLLSPALDRS